MELPLPLAFPARPSGTTTVVLWTEPSWQKLIFGLLLVRSHCKMSSFLDDRSDADQSQELQFITIECERVCEDPMAKDAQRHAGAVCCLSSLAVHRRSGRLKWCGTCNSKKCNVSTASTGHCVCALPNCTWSKQSWCGAAHLWQLDPCTVLRMRSGLVLI